jgi:hypothetical protein
LASGLKAALQNDKSVFSCWFVVLVFFRACALSVSMELCINSLHFHASCHCFVYIYIYIPCRACHSGQRTMYHKTKPTEKQKTKPQSHLYSLVPQVSLILHLLWLLWRLKPNCDMSSETGFHLVSPSQHFYQPNVSQISVVAHQQVVAHLFSKQ